MVQVDLKHTMYGNIPKDWLDKPLKEIATYRRGSFPQPYGLSKWYDEMTGKPFVQVFDVDDNMQLKAETKQKISFLGSKYSVFVPKGTIVLTLQGSIGRVAITQYDSYVDRTLLIFQKFIVPIDPVYLIYKIHQVFQIEKQVAPGGTIKTITKEALSSFNIHLPPTKAEQTAIATALSDMDALISNLEKLIEKKRMIKQGVLFQVFNMCDSWKYKKLGEHCTFFSGGTPPTANRNYYNGNIKWITSSDLNKTIINDVGGSITPEGFRNSSAQMINKGTLLVALYGATAGVVAISNIDAAINQAVLAVIPKDDNSKFLYYYLCFKMPKIVSTFIQGGQGNLNSRTFKSLSLPFPALNTQIDIANTLTAIDDDILCLENCLAKYMMLKDGMMQSLLSGKIRLI